jgi:hypothetical protein
MRWGQDHQDRVWTGLDVLSGLVEVIAEHVAKRRRDDVAIALGCSPWLTDDGVTDALTALACCLVVTKPERVPARVQQRLLADGQSVHKMWLHWLDEVGLPTEDGDRPVVRGYSDDPSHDVELGPLRVAGWRKRKGDTNKPIVHAKVVVLGYYGDRDIDTGDRVYSVADFWPSSVWWGSANLTRQSRQHLELATWSSEPSLVLTAAHFVVDVIAVSEPLTDIVSDVPSPEMVDAWPYEPDWDTYEPDWDDEDD